MNALVLFVIISLLIGIICCIATNSILLSLILLFIYIIYFLFFGIKKYKKGLLKINRFHDCYIFINNFIVALSIKKSIKSSLESVYVTMNDDLKEIYDSIKELSEEDKLSYLSKYFKFNVYFLFIDIVKLWLDQGGDIINMSHYLTNELRNDEEYISTCESIHKKKLIEFVVLWTFSLSILIFLRFSLSQFYNLICNKPFFLVGVGLIFLFLLFSLHMFISKTNDVYLKGWSDDEK